jgi:hypothetical protein
VHQCPPCRCPATAPADCCHSKGAHGHATSAIASKQKRAAVSSGTDSTQDILVRELQLDKKAKRSHLDSSKQPFTCSGSPVAIGSGKNTKARPLAAIVSAPPPSATGTLLAELLLDAAWPASGLRALLFAGEEAGSCGSGAAAPIQGTSPRDSSRRACAASCRGVPLASAAHTSHLWGCPTAPVSDIPRTLFQTNRPYT